MPLAPKRLFDTPSSMRSYKKQKRTMPITRRPLVPEVKELLVPFTILQVDNNAVVNVLATPINQGVAGNQRVGNRVKLLSIEVTGQFEFGSMLLVCPKNSTEPPLIGQFSNGKVPFFDADRGWTVFGFSPGALAQTNTVMDYGQLVKRFPRGMNLEYDANTPTKNALFLSFVNRQGLNLTNVSGNIRLRFVDS